MAISVPIVLKGLAGLSLAAAGTTGSYFIYDTFVNTGLTEEDKKLLKEVEKFSKFQKENSSDNTTTVTVDKNKKIKLIVSSNTTTPNFEIKLEASASDTSDTSANIIDNLKSWECKITPKTTPETGKTLSETQLTELKKSFGFDTTENTEKDFQQNQKDSISQFIKRCAYLGKRDVEVTNEKKLIREIKLNIENIETNNFKFSGFEKFFIKSQSQ